MAVGEDEIDLARLLGGPDSEPPPPTPITKNKATWLRGDHVEIGQRLAGAFTPKGAPGPVYTDGETYVYRPELGIWEVLGAHVLACTVHDFAGQLVAGKTDSFQLKIKSSDIKGALSVFQAEQAKPGFFNGAAAGICFKNGFVTLVHGKPQLFNHSPEFRARFAYGFDYVDGAQPTVMLAFLRSIYRDDADQQERIDFDQEFFGASLLGLAAKYHRVSVKENRTGGNGKSTLARIAAAMMPPGSVCSIPPQSWGSQGAQLYNMARLPGKLLNTVTELPSTDMENLETFKAVVAGDRVMARAIAKDPFDFVPVAGHFFSANALPIAKDLTQAFWDRVVVMPMTRTFRAGDADFDPDIAERVIADKAAVVSWLIQGAARLVKRGKYHLPASHVAAVDAWKLESDQVRQFIADEVTIGGDRWIASQTLYNRYTNWSQREGTGKLAQRKFAQRLADIGVLSKKTMYAKEWNCSFQNGGVV